MTATTEPLGLVQRTEPQPGDRIIIGHRVCLVNDRGGYDYPADPAPIAHPHAGPAMPLHQWPSLPAWALMGALMGALIVWGICS
jgi:hypothetical protein